MNALDPQTRCNGCGSRLPGHKIDVCPNCHAALVRVGVWSEFVEWGKTRRAGRRRYVWTRVLPWGAGMAMGVLLERYLCGNRPWTAYVAPFSINLTLAFCLAQWYWRTAEREYRVFVKQGRPRALESRPDEPAMRDHPLRDRLLDG